MKKISLQLLPHDVYIGTLKEHAKWHKKNLNEAAKQPQTSVAFVTHYTNTGKNGMSFVVLDIEAMKDMHPVDIADCCFHEATHVKQEVYEIIQGTPGREDEAYLIGYIGKEIYKYAVDSVLKLKEKNETRKPTTDTDSTGQV